MTFKQYVEWADVYPISQERFLMEKAFMELDLVALQMQAYDKLMESDLSLDQLDMIMLESRSLEYSEMLDAVYTEKVGGIIGAIRDLAVKVGKAIAAFFQRIWKKFKGDKAEAEQLQEEQKDLASRLQELAKKGMGEVGANNEDAVKAMILAAFKDAGLLGDDAKRLVDRADKMMGGGGCRVVPDIKEDNPIVVISKKIKDGSGSQVNEKLLSEQLTLCEPEYEVEAIAIIAEIENVIGMLNELMDIKGDEELGSDVAWNSFVKLMTTHGEAGAFERYQNLTEKITSMADSRNIKKFKMSEEVLARKKDAAENLNRIMTAIAKISDIGPEDNVSIPGQLGAGFQKNSPQVNQKEMNKHDFNARYNKDKELFANRGKLARPLVKMMQKGNYATAYTSFLRYVFNLSTSIQKAASVTIKSLSEHMNARQEAINQQKRLAASLRQGLSDASTNGADTGTDDQPQS